MVTALGPGRQLTRSPCATQADTSRKPGSDTAGIPASVTSSTVDPPRIAASNAGMRAASTAS